MRDISASDVENANCLWEYHNVSQKISKADCIIGLGSYDLRVAEKCSFLLEKEIAPWLLFTGKFGNWTKDKWQETEATIFGCVAKTG